MVVLESKLPPVVRMRIQENIKQQSGTAQANKGNADKACTFFGQGLSMVQGSGEFAEFGINLGSERTSQSLQRQGLFHQTVKPDLPMTASVTVEKLQKQGTVTIPPVVDEVADKADSPAADVIEEAPVIPPTEETKNSGEQSGQNSGQEQPDIEDNFDADNPFVD